MCSAMKIGGPEVPLEHVQDARDLANPPLPRPTLCVTHTRKQRIAALNSSQASVNSDFATKST